MLRVHPSQADKIESLMESILRHKHEDGTDLVLSGLLFQLFGHLARNQIIIKKKTSPKLASSATLEHIPLDKPIERALAYMDSNFTTRIQIDQLATLVNMSRSAFSKRFKRETGYTPLCHITRLRLVQAQYLLGTDMRIKDIARNTGFEDEFYFSRWFSKAEGTTPTRFRSTLQSHRSGLSKIHKAPI
jgi:transcriptional regulator GlxA family with amidase domain